MPGVSIPWAPLCPCLHQHVLCGAHMPWNPTGFHTSHLCFIYNSSKWGCFFWFSNEREKRTKRHYLGSKHTNQGLSSPLNWHQNTRCSFRSDANIDRRCLQSYSLRFTVRNRCSESVSISAGLDAEKPNLRVEWAAPVRLQSPGCSQGLNFGRIISVFPANPQACLTLILDDLPPGHSRCMLRSLCDTAGESNDTYFLIS